MRSSGRSADVAPTHGLALLLVALVLFELTAGTLYNLIVPPWQAPDEPEHFEYVKVLSTKLRPLAISDTDSALQKQILQSMMDNDFWRWHWLPRPAQTPTSFKQVWPQLFTMLHRPSLYYWLALPLLGMATDGSITDQLHAVRLLSTVLGALVVVIAFFTARALFPGDDFMASGTTLFVASVPMYSYMSGMFNIDMLLALTGAALVLSIALIFRRGLSWGLALAAFLIVIVGLLTKRASVFLLVMLIAVPVIYYWGRGGRRGKYIIGGALFLLVTTTAVVGLVALQPGILPALERPLRSYLAVDRRYTLALLDERYLSWQFVQMLWAYAEMASQSFWARFGWMMLPVDGSWYEVLKVLHVAAVLGLVKLIAQAWRGQSPIAAWQGRALLAYGLGFLALTVLAVAEVAYWFTPGRTPQGRYFFPLIVPMGLAFTLGWREVLPRQWRSLGLAAVGGFLLLLNAACLFWYSVGWFRWSL